MRKRQETATRDKKLQIRTYILLFYKGRIKIPLFYPQDHPRKLGIKFDLLSQNNGLVDTESQHDIVRIELNGLTRLFRNRDTERTAIQH